jgi:hypothetical protein
MSRVVRRDKVRNTPEKTSWHRTVRFDNRGGKLELTMSPNT